MKLRRAVAEDSPAIAAVVRAVYDEFGFTWDGTGYHADLRDIEASYAAFFVAELNGRIVGTAGLTVRGSLERLYVLSEARGSGAGSALLTAVVDEARRRDLDRLEIWSDKKNTFIADAAVANPSRDCPRTRPSEPCRSQQLCANLSTSPPRAVLSL